LKDFPCELNMFNCVVAGGAASAAPSHAHALCCDAAGEAVASCGGWRGGGWRAGMVWYWKWGFVAVLSA
jgi:hypothetical protein